MHVVKVWYSLIVDAILTLSRTQREKGRVITTIIQEMEKRIHPHIPMPVSLMFESSKERIFALLKGIKNSFFC